MQWGDRRTYQVRLTKLMEHSPNPSVSFYLIGRLSQAIFLRNTAVDGNEQTLLMIICLRSDVILLFVNSFYTQTATDDDTTTSKLNEKLC